MFCVFFIMQYHSDIGSDVYDDMYNHFSQGDSNCNSIDQSKSPQIMQVKHLGKWKIIQKLQFKMTTNYFHNLLSAWYSTRKYECI